LRIDNEDANGPRGPLGLLGAPGAPRSGAGLRRLPVRRCLQGIRLDLSELRREARLHRPWERDVAEEGCAASQTVRLAPAEVALVADSC
jgi:hypothetical protein